MDVAELKENLKKQIVEQLNLKEINPADIKDEQPLFVDGLGLDSIDALELILLLQQKYGVRLSRAEEGTKVFYSVDSMAEYILANKK